MTNSSAKAVALTTSHGLWNPSQQPLAAVRAVLLMAFGVLLLAVSAQFKIFVPPAPVPFTLQTLVVLVIGAAYGWRLGAATVIAYLAVGYAGLGVFAGGASGGAYMISYTGGYLVGFVVAAAAVGFLAEKGWDKSVLWTAVAMIIGSAIIYAFGVTWLSTLIGFEGAITGGMLQFLVSDAYKVAVAMAALPAAAWLVGRR